MTTDISTINSFKQELMSAHYKTLVNFMSNEENANKFMSAVVYSVQKTPKLLECDRTSLMNAFMTCAEFGMFPSSASGECYVLPYEKKKKVGDKWITDKVEAQFQLGYQGIVTLLYRAGVQSIRSDIYRKGDEFECVNGEIKHKIDFFKSSKDRGEAVGAYVIIEINGKQIPKAMHKDDIMKFKEFSKSKSSEYSPWSGEEKDPELWMWRKTVLKQASKLLPKNEAISKAIEADNQDSTISDAKILETPTDEIINAKLAGFSAEEGEKKPIS